MHVSEVHGSDESGMWLWQAVQVKEDEWMSTGKDFMFVWHPKMDDVISFWLRQIPGTDKVELKYVEVDTGYTVYESSYPANVKMNEIADLVTKEIRDKLARREQTTPRHGSNH